jgi:hypothetical protein
VREKERKKEREKGREKQRGKMAMSLLRFVGVFLVAALFIGAGIPKLQSPSTFAPAIQHKVLPLFPQLQHFDLR